MAFANTPKLGSTDPHETIFFLMGLGTEAIQSALSVMANTSRAVLLQDGEFDDKLQSFSGENGLRYKVPLQVLPGEAHTQVKRWNIHVTLENVRKMSANDQLPTTPQERKFWAEYPYLYWRNMFNPFMFWVMPTYAFCRVFQNRFPSWAKGRILPFAIAAAGAEQWAESTYPSHDLLTFALSQRTPLGDAARAEWQRLQPHSIPFMSYLAYNSKAIFGDRDDSGLDFGGDLSNA